MALAIGKTYFGSEPDFRLELWMRAGGAGADAAAAFKAGEHEDGVTVRGKSSRARQERTPFEAKNLRHATASAQYREYQGGGGFFRAQMKVVSQPEATFWRHFPWQLPLFSRSLTLLK